MMYEEFESTGITGKINYVSEGLREEGKHSASYYTAELLSPSYMQASKSGRKHMKMEGWAWLPIEFFKKKNPNIKVKSKFVRITFCVTIYKEEVTFVVLKCSCRSKDVKHIVEYDLDLGLLVWDMASVGAGPYFERLILNKCISMYEIGEW